MKHEIIRQIDKLGRICIPIDFRKSYDLSELCNIVFIATDDGILIKKKEAIDMNH